MRPWYEINNVEEIDSPSLLIYPDRIQNNLAKMIEMAGSVDRLWPHVKTHKMSEVIQMQIDAGFRQMKCATISEAEMLAIAGVQDILLAYQPVGPKVKRILDLVQQYPQVKFSALVDNLQIASQLSSAFEAVGQYLGIFLDIDNGGHRTGIAPNEKALELYQFCVASRGLITRGIHVYDGHVRMPSFAERQQKINEGFVPVENLINDIVNLIGKQPIVIAGGTPAFSVHAQRESVICSPGTCVLWDWGYGSNYKEMNFQYAGLVLSRVISKPSNNLLTCDLGHKAIAPDKPIPRVKFLNLPEAKQVGHSEEHMVLDVGDNSAYEIGMVLYGVPVHICPTCALHEEGLVIRDHELVDQWSVVSRKRMITV